MKTQILQLVEFDIVPASVNYPGIGRYSHDGGQIKYSPKLTKTGENYYNSKKELPDGFRMSTAAEELAIQLYEETSGRDPRKAEAFDDFFARNEDEWHAWQWTETGLRVPKGYEADKREKDTQGRIFYPRIVLIGDEEVGEVLVPEGNGKVVPYSSVPEEVWDTVFGIPRVTSDKKSDMKLDNHTTHFYFNTNPSKDSRSGEYDVAVARGSDWLRDGRAGCLHVYAFCGRWDVLSAGSFRPVQGSLPEIEKRLAKIDPKELKNTLLEEIKEDYNKLPPKEFQQKYSL